MRADLVLSTEAKSAIYLIKTEEGERTCHAFYLDDPLFEQKGGIIAIKDFNMVRPESIPWKDFSLPLPELDYYDYTLKATRKMHGAILKTANELDSQPVEIRMHQGSGDVTYDISLEKNSKPITRRQGTENPWLVYDEALPTAKLDLERHCIDVASVEDLRDEEKLSCLRSFHIDHNNYLKYKDILGDKDVSEFHGQLWPLLPDEKID